MIEIRRQTSYHIYEAEELGDEIARASTSDVALLLDALFGTIEDKSSESRQWLGMIANRLDRKTLRMMGTILNRRRKAGGRTD